MWSGFARYYSVSLFNSLYRCVDVFPLHVLFSSSLIAERENRALDCEQVVDQAHNLVTTPPTSRTPHTGALGSSATTSLAKG